MSTIKIHQLEYFLAIEKFHSFSEAALEINISQSTLSQQIAKLEKQLGTNLFVRGNGNRSIYLTRAGQEFKISAEKIVSEVHFLEKRMQKYATFEKGFLRLGLCPSFDVHKEIKNIITKFKCVYPDIDIVYHINTTDNLLEGIQNKKYHFAFVDAPFSTEYDLIFYPIIEEQIVAFIHKSHPLADKRIIDISDLNGQNLILYKSNTIFSKILLEAFAKFDVKPIIISESDYINVIKTFVDEEFGITLIGNRLAESLLTAKTTIVPIGEQIYQQSGLAVPAMYSSTSKAQSLTKVFRDFTLSTVAANETTVLTDD